MSNSAISYWRQTKDQIPLLEKEGEIISFTKVENNWIGIIKLIDKRITAPLVFNTKKPEIGDKVRAVLRILAKPNSEDLIEYGIKFQFIKEI